MNERLFWKATRPDLRTRNGYRWMFPGKSDRVPADPSGFLYPQVDFDGDYGLWVAKTFRGASFGGYGLGTVLIVSVPEDDILAESEDMARIRSYTTLEIVDVYGLIRRYGAHADFAGANFNRSDLAGADFAGADFSGAYLVGADLGGVNFNRAHLNAANFAGANLTDANFNKAALVSANFVGAHLRRANLTRANLARANFSGADLTEATLTLACLDGVKHSSLTVWPKGFDLTRLSKGSRR